MSSKPTTERSRGTRTPQAFVGIWLLYLAWKAKSTTFPVPNGQLGERGADRRVKRKALASLEKAGLITVDRRDRKTPRVTLVVL
jgi:DNA-binding transcriptional ArsR family regulator